MNEDWRLLGPGAQLVGAVLHRRSYFLWREDWDHDHCAFCWVPFELPGRELGLRDVCEGWTTEDEYHWVCDSCFADFRNRFGWKVRDRLPTDHPDTPWPQHIQRSTGEVEK